MAFGLISGGEHRTLRVANLLFYASRRSTGGRPASIAHYICWCAQEALGCPSLDLIPKAEHDLKDMCSGSEDHASVCEHWEKRR